MSLQYLGAAWPCPVCAGRAYLGQPHTCGGLGRSLSQFDDEVVAKRRRPRLEPVEAAATCSGLVHADCCLGEAEG